MQDGAFKKRIAEAVIARLEPIQQRYREIVADPSYLDSILAQGKNRVLPISEDTLQKARRAMGLYTH